MLRVNATYKYWRDSQSHGFEESLPPQGQSCADVLLSPACGQWPKTRGHPSWLGAHSHQQWQGRGCWGYFLIWMVLMEKDNRNTWSVVSLTCAFSCFSLPVSYFVDNWMVRNDGKIPGRVMIKLHREGRIAFLPWGMILLACRGTPHWLLCTTRHCQPTPNWLAALSWVYLNPKCIFKGDSIVLTELVHQYLCHSSTETRGLGRAVFIPNTCMTAPVAQTAGQICALYENLVFSTWTMHPDNQCVGRGWGPPSLLSSLNSRGIFLWLTL